MYLQMVRCLTRAALVMVLLVSALFGASAQETAQNNKPAVSGVLEYYLWAYEKGDRVESNQHARYLSLKANVNSTIGLTAGHMIFKGTQMLDENFVSLNKGDLHLQVGRFRPAFGIYSWDDNYYIPLLRAPIVRNNTIGNNYVQNRFDTGVNVIGGSRALQYQIGLVDDNAGAYEIMPTHPDHVLVRLQTYANSVILGANALVSMHDTGKKKTNMFGLDWRWTASQIQVRGEVFGGEAHGKNVTAYYVDAYYHPVALYRTTFGLRTEAVTTDKGVAQLYTLGARQVITPYLSLQISHSWENGIAPAAAYRGWAVQAITTLHF